MNFAELFILAIGLSMDAFAVSACKGLSVTRVKLKHMLIAGLWFGAFQAIMPLIGYYLGSAFSSYISSFSHWIALALLVFLGVKMIKEAFDDKEDDITDSSFGAKTMFLMAVATSIDALAVGIPLGAMPNINIWTSVSIIGITTFVISAIGVKIGGIFGNKYKKKAEITGGVILILLGIKIVLSAYGILP